MSNDIVGGFSDRFFVTKVDAGFLVWDCQENESVDITITQELAQTLCDNLNFYWQKKCITERKAKLLSQENETQSFSNMRGKA
jgi:hypothetical protein